MHRFLSCVAALVVTSWGCNGSVPIAPTGTLQPPEGVAEFATVSGWVYARVETQNAPLADALIEVRESGGSERIALTNADGFYELTVRAGAISITASKEGYEAKTWQFSLLKDTALNFGLSRN